LKWLEQLTNPELKAQFEAAAKAEGMSLGNWLKTLGRRELIRLGYEPFNNSYL